MFPIWKYCCYVRMIDLHASGLITRSLAEMTRIGSAYGASPLTFLSLAGVFLLLIMCKSWIEIGLTLRNRGW